jgi:predicted aspartyl protease
MASEGHIMRIGFSSLLVVASLSAAPETAGQVRGELPFEIASNKPYVQVSINGSAKQWFILDSGCSGTSVIAKECAERAGLHGGGETETHLGAGAGVRVGVAAVHDVTLEVGGATMASPELRIFPLAHVSPFEGRRVDGLLGQDFLERHVVEIDYARGRIRILDPTGFAPPAAGASIPIRLQDGLAVAEGAVTVRGGDSIPCRLVIDTGVRATLILYRPFAVAHRLLDAPGNLLGATVGGGAGGETRGDIGRLAMLRIGPSRFEKPVAIFSRDTVGVFASSDPDGIIGGELLRRAKVTFDYPHGRIILEPYASPPAFEYDMSGLFLVAGGDAFQHILVRSATRGTPAAAVGLEPDDEIVAIDGRRSPSLTLEEARRIFRAPGTRRLEVRRGERHWQVTLVTRRLV